MPGVKDFVLAQNAFNDRQDAAIGGLTADVAGLKAEIERLQNTPGPITPEDQALLDSIQARADGIATRLEALDAQTEARPEPPTEPPSANR